MDLSSLSIATMSLPKHPPCRLQIVSSATSTTRVLLDHVPLATEYSMVLFVDNNRVRLQVPNGLGWKYHFGCPLPETARHLQDTTGNKHAATELVTPSGILLFTSPSQNPIRVYIYTCSGGCGGRGGGGGNDVKQGQWYAPEQIPYNDMWADDRYWMPQVLRGQYVEGHFVFDGSPGTDTPLVEHVVEFYQKDGSSRALQEGYCARSR